MEKITLSVNFGNSADCSLIKNGEEKTIDNNGYLPAFLGGDELHLEINPKTGKILNWDKKAYENFIKENEEGEEKMKEEYDSLITYSDYFRYICKWEDKLGEDEFQESKYYTDIPLKLEIEHCIKQQDFCPRVDEFLTKEELYNYYDINNKFNYDKYHDLIHEDNKMMKEKTDSLKNILKEKWGEKHKDIVHNYKGNYKTLISNTGVHHHLNNLPLFRFYNILNLLFSKGFFNIKPLESLGFEIAEEDCDKAKELLKKNNCYSDNFLINKSKAIKYENRFPKRIISSSNDKFDNSILEEYIKNNNI